MKNTSSTTRESELYKYIKNFQQKNDNAPILPIYKVIGKDLGISRQRVEQLLKSLESKGYIQRPDIYGKYCKILK